MKKLIYLVLSVLCGISGIYGIYDTITTPQDDLDTSIIAILLLAFLAWLFMHLFLKPEPRHKHHQAANMPESSPEAASDAPTVETAPITHVNANSGVEDDYVAVDIETTGLGRDARIIELGAVRIRHGRKVASFSQLVNPQIPIPAKVTQITGITDRNVRHQPTIDKALPRFYAFCGHDTWIGHNIRRFDLPVIAREAERVGAACLTSASTTPWKSLRHFCRSLTAIDCSTSSAISASPRRSVIGPPTMPHRRHRYSNA